MWGIAKETKFWLIRYFTCIAKETKIDSGISHARFESQSNCVTDSQVPDYFNLDYQCSWLASALCSQYCLLAVWS